MSQNMSSALLPPLPLGAISWSSAGPPPPPPMSRLASLSLRFFSAFWFLRLSGFPIDMLTISSGVNIRLSDVVLDLCSTVDGY